MKKLILFLPLCFIASLPAVEPMQAGLLPSEVPPIFTENQASRVFEVGIDFWMMPRDANRVMQEPSITQAVRVLLVEPESYLELRYPEGEMGELWGQELQAWLVALGVVSDRIELLLSLEPIESVVLVVVDPTTVIDDEITPLGMPSISVEEAVEQAEPVTEESQF